MKTKQFESLNRGFFACINHRILFRGFQVRANFFSWKRTEEGYCHFLTAGIKWCILSILLLSCMGILPVMKAEARTQSARAWIGIGIEKGTKGILINKVFPGTPGYQAGLQKDDEIVSIDNIPVMLPAALIEQVTNKGVGNSVSLTIVRLGKTQEVQLKLAAKPDQRALLQKNLLGQKAPPISLHEVFSDKPYDSSKRDSIKIVMFWATWCPACKASLPLLRSIAPEFKKLPLPVDIVLVSTETPQEIKGYLTKSDAEVFETLTDSEGAVSSAYGVSALPTFVVLDGSGIARAAEIGAGQYLDDIMSIAKHLATDHKKDQKP